MSRWIEVEPLIEAHYQHCNKNHGEADVFYAWSLELMRNAPSLDLVRCAECKHWRAYETWSECELWTDDPYETAKTKADDFCSYGERKESE